jgi:thiol-disulfide isomerase/thioredoxin
MMQTLQSNAFETLVVEFKKYLALQVPSELAVVFLTGSDCKYCVEMREVIDRVMPRYIGKVQFFTVNLSENKSVVSKAEGSVYQDGSDASIQHVPVVIFYRKQMPIARFKGQYNEHDFAQFIASSIEGSVAVPAYAPPPSYAPPPAAGYEQPVAASAYQQPYAYQQQPQQYQQQQHYQQPTAAPAKLQQSYYNTPYRQPPLQQHQQDLYNRPGTASAAAADNALSIENCSGRKFCYSTYANAYNSC